MRTPVRFLPAICLLLLSVQSAMSKTAQHQTQHGPITVEDIAEFNRPWGMAFVTPSSALVTERIGSLWLVNIKTGKKVKVSKPPRAQVEGQGGLLDVALHPDFKNNGWVYFTLARQVKGGSGTAVVRAKLTGLNSEEPTLTDHQLLYQVKPSSASHHFGSRIAFAPDGTFYVTFGDHGERPRAQDTSNASGSVIRLLADGANPADNPAFAPTSGSARDGLWSIGHRNPQGAAIHPLTGKLWTVEHGARGGDEINRPEAGKNYGWPTISYGKHYTGGKIGKGSAADGMEQPVYYWDPSIAPSGLAFYSGTLFPHWQNSLFVGALKHKKLIRLTVIGGEVTGEEILLENAYGRIRDVSSGPNGALWLLTDSSKGKLLRISPTK